MSRTFLLHAGVYQLFFVIHTTSTKLLLQQPSNCGPGHKEDGTNCRASLADQVRVLHLLGGSPCLSLQPWCFVPHAAPHFLLTHSPFFFVLRLIRRTTGGHKTRHGAGVVSTYRRHTVAGDSKATGLSQRVDEERYWEWRLGVAEVAIFLGHSCSRQHAECIS